ncbi:MAG: GNAT family N-acetyltransferase [Alphaproteobacteria bacterium]|nr:GNAT family N-acetyltransferase [Alphaproteobacteria bacterium]
MIRQVLVVPKGIALDCFYIMNQFVDVNGAILDHICDSVGKGQAVMFVDEKPNGFLTGFLTGRVSDGVGYVQNLYVDKRYHRCGIGGTLLDAYQNYCVGNKVKQIMLTTRPTQQAINFYVKNGFVQTSINKLMQKSL